MEWNRTDGNGMEWKGMEWNGREGIEWNRRAGNETGMVDWPDVFSYLPFQCLPVQWQVPESDGPIIRHGHKPREVFIEAERKDHPWRRMTSQKLPMN